MGRWILSVAAAAALLGAGCAFAQDTGSGGNAATGLVERLIDAAISGGLYPPRQLYPPNGRELTNFPRTLTLEWERVPKATAYDLEIDCYQCRLRGRWDTDVGGPWRAPINVHGTQYDLTFVGDTRGRWRVRSVRKSRASRWSPWSYFSFNTSRYAGHRYRRSEYPPGRSAYPNQGGGNGPPPNQGNYPPAGSDYPNQGYSQPGNNAPDTGGYPARNQTGYPPPQPVNPDQGQMQQNYSPPPNGGQYSGPDQSGYPPQGQGGYPDQTQSVYPPPPGQYANPPSGDEQQYPPGSGPGQ